MKDTQRLDKVLSNLGYGTRKEIKQRIRVGKVRVDGVAASDPGMQVNPLQAFIELDSVPVRYREFVYVMMNKPKGVISATFDNHHETVIDILPDGFKKFGLFPAGRLDIDTEGLLLLTNDGQLAHDLLSPRKHVPKRYYALVEGKVAQEDIDSFKAGVMLDDGYRTLPAELYIIRQGDFSETELVIHEGKFHQVKRMFEATGKSVTYLKRLSMGALELDKSLQPGECRELTDEECKKLGNVT